MQPVAQDKNITIVIPTYNEAENISKLIPVIMNLPLPSLKVLVIDDNSQDGTGELVEKLSATYPGRIQIVHRSEKLGLGTAYIHGFQLALKQGADAVGQMDADFSHPPEKLVELAQYISDYDVVLGSRYIPGGSVDRNWPVWRKGLSAFGNFYARTILGLPIRDVTGGFRLYNRDALRQMPLERVRSNGYVFQVEMTYLAYRLGFHFKEIPIYFADRRWGQSKMSFRIQVEAAIRTWTLPLSYRGIKRR